MPEFIPGLALCEQFFREAVQPILNREFPSLRYSAALFGPGSEVLGFDTEMSADHHWGPRAMLFLREIDYGDHRNAIRALFSRDLPHEFRGYSTNFTPPDPQDSGTQTMQALESGRINHRVEILTVAGFFADYLDFDVHGPIRIADWLTIPQQKLRSITAGAVFHDDLGLRDIRDALAWYPRDVWLYLLASQWSRIAQEEPFVGRTGTVGDELGSRVIAARLVQHSMRLCFLMERQYAPYSKWFGTAFNKLQCAPKLAPLFDAVLNAPSWQQRGESLCRALEFMASKHNGLKITAPLPANASPFFDRPFNVIHGGAFAQAIRAQIQNEAVKSLDSDIGSVDVFSDSTDLLEATHLRTELAGLYGAAGVGLASPA